MFSAILVASLILPGVLGGCCFPQKMTCVTFEADSPIANKMLVDFSQNKMLNRPFGHRVIEFELTDLSAGKMYTKNHDGSCTKKDVPTYMTQCIPDVANTLGSAYLGGNTTLEVQTYTIMTQRFSSAITVTMDACIPVIGVNVMDGVRHTQFYTNVNSSILQDVSDLNQDVSDCIDDGDLISG